MIEVISNSWTTKINMPGGLPYDATVVTVVDPAGWPGSGNFRLKCDQELIKVTGVSGNDMTIERGVEGTTPTFHANGSQITNTLTAEALMNLIMGI